MKLPVTAHAARMQIVSQIERGVTPDEQETLFAALKQIDEKEHRYAMWQQNQTGEWQPSTAKTIERPCVYLVRDHSGRTKIGVARNFKKRFFGLQTAASDKLKAEHVIYTSDPFALEAELHRTYKHKRVHGEWFNLTAQDIADIRARYK